MKELKRNNLMKNTAIEKILRYLMIIFITGYIINKLLFFGLIYLYFGGGVTPASKMEEYKFNTTVINLKKELQTICDRSIYLSYQNSVYGKNSTNQNSVRIFKDGEKLTYFLELDKESYDKDMPVNLSLYFINGKGEDDFGWFSNEKRSKVKLFQDSIINPLSKKFERIEVED